MNILKGTCTFTIVAKVCNDKHQLSFLAEVYTGLSQSGIALGEREVGNLVSRWFVMCRLEYFLGPIPFAFGLGNGSLLSFVLKH